MRGAGAGFGGGVRPIMGAGHCHSWAGDRADITSWVGHGVTLESGHQYPRWGRDAPPVTAIISHGQAEADSGTITNQGHCHVVTWGNGVIHVTWASPRDITPFVSYSGRIMELPRCICDSVSPPDGVNIRYKVVCNLEIIYYFVILNSICQAPLSQALPLGHTRFCSQFRKLSIN